jgi:hypothetical protein
LVVTVLILALGKRRRKKALRMVAMINTVFQGISSTIGTSGGLSSPGCSSSMTRKTVNSTNVSATSTSTSTITSTQQCHYESEEHELRIQKEEHQNQRQQQQQQDEETTVIVTKQHEMSSLLTCNLINDENRINNSTSNINRKEKWNSVAANGTNRTTKGTRRQRGSRPKHVDVSLIDVEEEDDHQQQQHQQRIQYQSKHQRQHVMAKQETKQCWYLFWKDQLLACLHRLLIELNPYQNWFTIVDPHLKHVLDIPSSFVPSSTAALVTYFDTSASTTSTSTSTGSGSLPKYRLNHKHQSKLKQQRQIIKSLPRTLTTKVQGQVQVQVQVGLDDHEHDDDYDYDCDYEDNNTSGTGSSDESGTFMYNCDRVELLDDDYDNDCDKTNADANRNSHSHSNDIDDNRHVDEELTAPLGSDMSAINSNGMMIMNNTNTMHKAKTATTQAIKQKRLQQHHNQQTINNNWTLLLRRRVLIISWKVLLFATTTLTIVLGCLNVARPAFYLAYLTHWSMTFCGLYVTINLINCLCFNSIQQPSSDDTVPVQIKITWFLFQLASHTAAGAAFVFWPIRHLMGMPLSYNIIMNHGGIVSLVLFDGLYINRIPYRIMHWYTMVLPIQLLYVVWSLIHDLVTDIGNPDRYHPDDPYSNDDALYPSVLEWNTPKWPVALITSFSIIFVLGPAILLGFWYISIYPLPLSNNFGTVSYTRLRYYMYATNHIPLCTEEQLNDDDDDEQHEQLKQSCSTASTSSSELEQEDDEDFPTCSTI